ncbi:HAD-like domain [Phytophthora cactorum]|nr:HAD-like domain [Phytophthora cactorum]
MYLQCAPHDIVLVEVGTHFDHEAGQGGSAAAQGRGHRVRRDMQHASRQVCAAEQKLRKVAAEKKRQQTEERFGSSLFGPKSIKSMLVSDMRSLLKDLNEDSTGKPWVVKERLQSTLQGLPNQKKEKAAAGKSEDEVYLEKQLQSASEELARMKQQKEEQKLEREEWSKKGFGMEGQFDMFVAKEDQEEFPDPKPILHICEELGLKPSDVLVLARHAPTIKAAKYAYLLLIALVCLFTMLFAAATEMQERTWAPAAARHQPVRPYRHLRGVPRRQRAQDWLFIVTQRFQFCVLAYDSATQQVVTKAHGSIRDSIGRSSEIVTSGNIDPEGRLIGMNLYEGYFKVIPIDSGKGILRDTFNIRLDELRVIDIKFLHGYNKPTICVLYEDYKAARHLKTYHILLKEKDFAEGPWSVLIVSSQTIVYHNGSTFHAIPMQSTVIQVYGAVDKDGSRFLLADQYGTLSVVALQHTGKEVSGVHLEVLGETNIASCLSYLDNGVVFIGSTFGDSQLVKLTQTATRTDRPRQIVTCSGADKDGTLRVIRNGIGINEQASAELPGIKGMWSLRETFSAEYDKYLVQSYVSEIRILAIGDEDEMEEKEIPAFTNAKTLLCRNMYGDYWLQVTESEVRLISCTSFSLSSTWSPASGSRITVAAANPTQVAVATSGGVLVYLEVENGQVTEKTTVTMEHEIACVDITPLASNDPGDGDVSMTGSSTHWDMAALRSSLCVVGLWTTSRCLIYSNNNKLLYSNINSKEVNVMCPFDSESFPECLALSSEEELTIGTVDDIQKLHIQTFHLNEWARRIAHDPESHTLGVLTVSFTVDDTGEEVDQGYVRLFDDQTFEVLHSYRLDPFETPCSVVVCPFAGDSVNASYFVVGTAYIHEEEAEPHQGRILVFAVTGIHGERKLQLVTEKEVKGAVYCLNSFNGKVLAGVNSKAQLYKWSENTDNEKELVSECGHYGHTLVLYMESRGDFIVVGDLMKSISLLSYKQLDGTIEEIAKDLNSNWMSAVGIIDDDTYVGSETDFNLFTVQRNSGAASDEERGRLETVGEFHLGEFVNRFRYGSLVMQNSSSTSQALAAIASTGSTAMVDVGEAAPVAPAVQNQSMLFGTVSGMIGVILPINKDQEMVLGGNEEDIYCSHFTCSLQGKTGKEDGKLPAIASPSPSKKVLDGNYSFSFPSALVCLKRPSWPGQRCSDAQQTCACTKRSYSSKTPPAKSPSKPTIRVPSTKLSVPVKTSSVSQPTAQQIVDGHAGPGDNAVPATQVKAGTPTPEILDPGSVGPPTTAEDLPPSVVEPSPDAIEAVEAAAVAEEAERIRKINGTGMVKLIYESYDELFRSRMGQPIKLTSTKSTVYRL